MKRRDRESWYLPSGSSRSRSSGGSTWTRVGLMVGLLLLVLGLMHRLSNLISFKVPFAIWEPPSMNRRAAPRHHHPRRLEPQPKWMEEWNGSLLPANPLLIPAAPNRRSPQDRRCGSMLFERGPPRSVAIWRNTSWPPLPHPLSFSN